MRLTGSHAQLQGGRGAARGSRRRRPPQPGAPDAQEAAASALAHLPSPLELALQLGPVALALREEGRAGGYDGGGLPAARCRAPGLGGGPTPCSLQPRGGAALVNPPAHNRHPPWAPGTCPRCSLRRVGAAGAWSDLSPQPGMEAALAGRQRPPPPAGQFSGQAALPRALPGDDPHQTRRRQRGWGSGDRRHPQPTHPPTAPHRTALHCTPTQPCRAPNSYALSTRPPSPARPISHLMESSPMMSAVQCAASGHALGCRQPLGRCQWRMLQPVAPLQRRHARPAAL